MASNGTTKALGDAVEGELHLEALLVDDQVPEAMLEDDRHLLGIFLLQALREIATPARDVLKAM